MGNSVNEESTTPSLDEIERVLEQDPRFERMDPEKQDQDQDQVSATFYRAPESD